MDYHSGELVGGGIGCFLLGLPALIFLSRALQKKPRSLRLAYLSLFCGLSILLVPEMVFHWVGPERPEGYIVSGALRALLGLVGIGLAIWSLIARSDGGTGVARPIVGMGFSLIHGLEGLGICVVFGLLHPGGNPWIYNSPDGAFSITLPSNQWKQAPASGAVPVVAFVRSVPHMQAAVLWMRQKQSKDDFESAKAALMLIANSDPKRSAQNKFRDGTNASGNAYFYLTTMDSTADGKPVFVAQSLVWNPNKQVLLQTLFEGMPTMLSEMGKQSETRSFEQSAEAICTEIQ